MPRHEVRGGAGTLTLNANITSVSTTCQANGVTTGFPTGAVNPFVVTIDSERILCASTTGSSPATITFAQRGYDGTTADAHTANADIVHGLAAADIDDLYDHAYDAGRDDHLNYLTPARHATTAHTSGMYDAQSVDNAALDDDAVDARVIAADAIESQHIGDDQVLTTHIADDQITTALIADDAVTAPALADDAVTTPAIADDAITSDQLATDSVTDDAIAPDSVGTSELKNDAVATANIADDAVTPAKLSFEIDSGSFLGNTGASGQVAVSFGHTFAAAPKVFVQIADNMDRYAVVNFTVAPPTTTGFVAVIHDGNGGAAVGVEATRFNWFAITNLA